MGAMEENLDDTPFVGKPELLKWMSTTLGESVTRFEGLRDGSIILRVMGAVFPAVGPMLVQMQWCPQPQSQLDINRNWDIVESLWAQLQLPKEGLDRRGLLKARFKPCYQIVVIFYFLYFLQRSERLAADLKHPIDD
eukprot:Hpha_TRINITY_DN3543_c0_g1::TRINITY_DN3543_c0_g1_i1::g.25787::m.25787